MNPEELQQGLKRERLRRFLQGSGKSDLAPKKISYKITNLSGIIPKKSIPQQVVEKISSPVQAETADQEQIAVSSGVISSLGRLTLNLEGIGNDLDVIASIIKEDYKQTQEINRKEIEDYRKRVANRGRVVGKKEFGDRKIDVAGLIKKYVGTFFSGTGGAIRSLAGLNILEGIMSGDPLKILGGLTGITASYLPAIGMAVGGKVVSSIGKGIFKRGPRGFGGLAREARPLARFTRGGGGRFALGAGILTAGAVIGGKIFGGGGQADQVQQMIQPKQDAAGGDLLMPQDLLKKFDDINDKFSQAVDRLLGGGGPPPPGQQPYNPDLSLRGSAGRGGYNNAQLVSLAKRVGATDDEAVRFTIAMHESTGVPTKHNTNASTGDNSYGLWQINMLGKMGPERRKQFGISSNDELFDPVTNAQAALTVLRRSGFSSWTTNKDVTQQELTQGRKSLGNFAQLPSPSTTPPVAPILPSPREVAMTPPTTRTGPTIVPVPVGADAPSQTSSSVGGNDIVPAINTTYSENFLALYSRLIYQIV